LQPATLPFLGATSSGLVPVLRVPTAEKLLDRGNRYEHPSPDPDRPHLTPRDCLPKGQVMDAEKRGGLSNRESQPTG
jgi:hypothetical protein